MKSWLNGKTFVITGASGGLGFSLAKHLILYCDCKVIGIGRNEKKFIDNINTLGDKKENFSYKLFDVSSFDNWAKFAKELVDTNTQIDAIVNNAGFMLPFDKFENLELKQIVDITSTNFLSSTYSVKSLMPILKKSKTPAIINVSSSAGLCAVVGQSMYASTKFALRGFTDSLRVEYKDFYVCGVYPGFIKTDIFSSQQLNEKDAKLINKFMMPLDKATNKIIRKIKAKRKKIVLGFDGKFLAFGGKYFPHLTAKLTAKVLKISKLELFKNLFEGE